MDKIIDKMKSHNISESNVLSMINGWIGERIVRNYIKGKVSYFMQADLIVFTDNRYVLFEIKRQEKYQNPDGHGLPPFQVKHRIDLYNSTGIEPFLVIVDPEDNCIYSQSLVILENSKRGFLTKTGSRIIYPIDLFKISIT